MQQTLVDLLLLKVSFMKDNFFSEDEKIIFYNSLDKSILDHKNIRPKILVFDSGIGGLSVSKHLEEFFDYADIIYIADNEFFPYGGKDKKILTGRITKLIIQAINIFDPIGLVVACNTASTLLSDEFIRSLNIPCMRVLPPIQEAFDLSLTKNVLLIATPNTIESEYVKIESDKIVNKEYIFHKLGVAELVKLAEKKSRNELVTLEDITKVILKELSQEELAEVDVVILGCTHFPSLQEELKEILFNVKYWIDPAYNIVNQLHQILQRDLSISSKGKYLFYTSTLKDDSFHIPYFNNGFQ